MQVNFEGSEKNYVEKDRSILLNLSQQFDDERQVSNKFKLSGKIVNIYSNSISGTSSYEPFLNELYLINPEESITEGSPFFGFPPREFSFIRKTTPTNHIEFYPMSVTVTIGHFIFHIHQKMTMNKIWSSKVMMVDM